MRRIATLALGLVLAVAGLGGTAASAVAVTVAVPPIGPTPPAASQCTSAPYPDVSTTNPFCVDIVWLTNQKIAQGYSDGDFHPAEAVSRQAMAVFLYHYLHPGATLAPCTTKPFSDVDVADASCPSIAALKAANVLSGYGTMFHPDAPVSRQAMAAFLYRISTSAAAPACTSAPYPDVPTSNPFCGDIHWLADKGVVSGYSGGGYHPTDAVSRQAMAHFLHELYIATH